MDDEQQWKRKQTLTERDGSGRWGGGFRTAVGMEGDGDKNRGGGALRPRLAISHSNPAVTFAVECFFSKTSKDNLFDIATPFVSDLPQRRQVRARIADIVITDLNSPSTINYDQAADYSPRVIALVPTDIASRYLWRLYRLGVSVCPLQFGLETLYKTVIASLHKNDNEIVYEQKVMEFFTASPCVEGKINELRPGQRNLLRRLEFTDEDLISEYNEPEFTIKERKEKLFQALDVKNAEQAIQLAELYDVTQFPANPDPLESKNFDKEVAESIQTWLSNTLTQSNVWRP